MSPGDLAETRLHLRDERVLVLELDREPDDWDLLWTGYQDSRHEVSLVAAQVGGRIRVLDAMRGTGDLRVRWWKVTALARAEGLDPVSPSWDGPASGIPARFFTKDPTRPERVVLVRLSDAGPWARLEMLPSGLAEARGG